MANANLKKDFKDGDKLFAHQLNNNFAAIEAALSMMNKIVWQGDEDADAVVTFRGTTEELEEREIINGQLLYNVDTGETYIDYDDERISTGSGNAIHIGASTPENPSTQLWIDPTEPLQSIGSEIGNEYSESTQLGYSADYLNKRLPKVGVLTPATGTTINYSSFINYGKLLIFVASITANETLPRFSPIAYFDIDELVGSQYVFDVENNSHYINNSNKALETYAEGGMEAEETRIFSAVVGLGREEE